MWVYVLLLFVVGLLLIVSAIYIVKTTSHIFTKYIKNKIVVKIISFVPIILFIIGLFIDTVNGIVVDIYLIAFIFLVKCIAFIVKKMFKFEVKETYIVGIGILLTLFVLINAHYRAFNVVETDYTVYTEKNIGTKKFRIVQISDSHIGTTIDGKKFSKYMDDINALEPDIVVLTGDYVDDNTKYQDMIDASEGLSHLKTKYGVYFIYGNHDKGYSNYRDFTDTEIKEELAKNNVVILEDEIVDITDKIVLIGRCDKENKNRLSIMELVKDLDHDKYLIVLNHQPNDYQNESQAKVDLVLSGHTHGGQLFPLGELGLLLGANNKIYGMEKQNQTTFIVNSGISDWAIKFKTGTISEYVVIDIKND